MSAEGVDPDRPDPAEVDLLAPMSDRQRRRFERWAAKDARHKRAALDGVDLPRSTARGILTMVGMPVCCAAIAFALVSPLPWAGWAALPFLWLLGWFAPAGLRTWWWRRWEYLRGYLDARLELLRAADLAEDGAAFAAYMHDVRVRTLHARMHDTCPVHEPHPENAP